MNVSSIHKRDISKRLIPPSPGFERRDTRTSTRVPSLPNPLGVYFYRGVVFRDHLLLSRPTDPTESVGRDLYARSFFLFPPSPFPVFPTRVHIARQVYPPFALHGLLQGPFCPRPSKFGTFSERGRRACVRACVADAYLRCTYVARRARCNTKISGGSVEATRRKVKLSSHVSR